MTTPRRLADELGLPAGSPVVEWVDGAGVVDQALTEALAGYSVTAGRGDPWANVEATTCTAQLVHQLAGRVPKVGELVQLRLGAAVADALGVPAGDRVRFTGETHGRRLDDDGGLAVQLVGRRARLGRLYVGDEPWPAELDGARALRVLQLAQQLLPDLAVGDVDPGTVTVLARDVDRQPALALLDELADTAAGQLVELRNGELTWHDAEHRRNQPAVVELSASQVQAGLSWTSDLAGMVNTLRVSYGVDPGDGQPRVEHVDQAAVDAVGVIEAELQTQLADAGQALDRARLIVGRRSTAWWEAPALTVELLRTVDRDQLVQLLHVEHGDVVRVTGLPRLGPFTTSRLVVEGYTEQLTRDAWQLQLAVADTGVAGAPVRWGDVPATVSWAELPAGMTWLQAARWQPDPDQLGRWLDQPADLAWLDVDPGLTWATYPTE